jgi:hypothetical protein
MPYSSPYNHASSDLRAAIIASFFEDAPQVLAATLRPETPIVFRCGLQRPEICHSGDRGEITQSEEDRSSDTAGEIYSTYGTPEGLPWSTFSFYLEVDNFPANHRHHGGGGGSSGGAAAAAEVWGENNNWGIRRVSQAAQTERPHYFHCATQTESPTDSTPEQGRTAVMYEVQPSRYSKAGEMAGEAPTWEHDTTTTSSSGDADECCRAVGGDDDRLCPVGCLSCE